MTNEIKVSIRNLVEFVLRSGSLDNRFVGISRALEGTKTHQKIQKSYGEGYASEVALIFSMEHKGFLLTLEGRVDGIFSEEGSLIVDEIKTTNCPLEFIHEDFNLLHWAQAKCYAYIYGVQNNANEMGIQLTYYQLDTEEKKCFRKKLSIDELKEFFYSLLDRYLSWAVFTANWRIKRDETIKSLKFPFDSYRKGQKELAKAVYKTITSGKKLFVQAPTGTGKTISTLFPAVKAIGEGHIARIFYLTARTTTRQVAEEAFSRMKECGLEFKTITLTAKEKICFNKGAGCNPEQCSCANGYFDRVNEAVASVLSAENNLTREVIEEYSERYNVCPFEFSLDLSLWVDCVICDYNYVFDPRVYLKRFFLNNRGDYVFLIDEAHNLVERAREMFSAELYKSSFLQVKKIMEMKGRKIYKILGKLNTLMLDLKKQCEEEGRDVTVKTDEPGDLYPLLREFVKEADLWLSGNHDADGFDELLELYFNVLIFIKISEFYDERYVTYFEMTKNDVKIKLFCLDPSFLLGEAAKRGKAAVFFSATLTPLSYFRNILGGYEDSYTMKLDSPFYSENLCLLLADRISTKYKNRENSYLTIAEHIEALVRQKTGNYMVYFPSYMYMNEVIIRFVNICPDIAVAVQSASMAEEERDIFLERFQPQPGDTLVGFGVLGGIFSEGIDLKDDRLIGAVIVGVGLSQISPEQNVIMNYFDERNQMGYEYAYMFPGMNKVLQAAGRVIRSENDKGVVLLIDERFSHENYRELFPENWSHYIKTRGLKELRMNVARFWDSHTDLPVP